MGSISGTSSDWGFIEGELGCVVNGATKVWTYHTRTQRRQRAPESHVVPRLQGCHLVSLPVCGSRVEHHAVVPVSNRAGHRDVEQPHAQLPVLEDADRLVGPQVFLRKGTTTTVGCISRGEISTTGRGTKRVECSERRSVRFRPLQKAPPAKNMTR